MQYIRFCEFYAMQRVLYIKEMKKVKRIFIVKKHGIFIRKKCYVKGKEVYILTVEFFDTLEEALQLA